MGEPIHCPLVLPGAPQMKTQGQRSQKDGRSDGHSPGSRDADAEWSLPRPGTVTGGPALTALPSAWDKGTPYFGVHFLFTTPSGGSASRGTGEAATAGDLGTPWM